MPTIASLNGSSDYRTLAYRAETRFSIGLWLSFSDLAPGRTIIDNRYPSGKGFALTTTDHGTIRFDMCDAWEAAFWECDRRILSPGTPHYIAVIGDDGPKMICPVTDEILCDGGEDRTFGWGHFASAFRDVNSNAPLRIAPDLNGKLLSFRIYDRPLRISEAIRNYRTGT